MRKSLLVIAFGLLSAQAALAGDSKIGRAHV